MGKTLIKYISQFLLLPLLEKLGKWLHTEYKEWIKRKAARAKVRDEVTATNNAQTPEEIRDAHRRSVDID